MDDIPVCDRYRKLLIFQFAELSRPGAAPVTSADLSESGSGVVVLICSPWESGDAERQQDAVEYPVGQDAPRG